MYLFKPDNWNGLLILADSRLPTDEHLDRAESGTHVLEFWKFGRHVLGDEVYTRTARLALWDAGTTKEQLKATRDEKRAAMLSTLEQLEPKVVIVLQTRKKTVGSAFQGTSCWSFLDGPGTITDAAGTAWENGPIYVPILNPEMYDAVYWVYIARWMRAALALLTGRASILRCTDSHIHPSEQVIALLEGYLRQSLISFDIESIPGRNTLTAINLSDGVSTVSLPWDGYGVYPAGYQQALETLNYGPQCKALILAILSSERITKLGHNSIGFDTIELARKGIQLQGSQEDTILLHAALHNQFRHALQLAVATELIVPPWKSAHKPVAKSHDSWEFWAAAPEALRTYGAQDAFYPHKLWEVLERKLG